MRGYPDRANDQMARSLAIAAELDHPYSTAYAIFHAALIDLWRGDLVVVGERAEVLLHVADAHDYAIWRALALVLRGLAAIATGDQDTGMADLDQGFELYGALTTPPVFWPGLLMMRSEAYAAAGRLDDALATMRQAQNAVDEADPLSEHMAIAHADLLLASSPPDREGAEALLDRAAVSARERGARMALLEALTRLLVLRRGTPAEAAARDGLAEVLGCFTEGFDVSQLRAATAALEA
jgi:ATP/maltotriose-dependent transcriptional regulator MalT